MAIFSDSEKKNFENLEKLFPKCIVDHSFTDDSENKVSGEEVYNVLKQSGSLFTEIINTWFNAVPFNSRIAKNKKLDK